MTVDTISGDDDDAIDGVVVSDAFKRAESIRRGLDAWTDVLSLIIEAYKAKDWEALGHADWGEYVGKEFQTNLLKLSAKTRKEWIPQLKDAGMTTREIAPVMNVDQSTVVRDAKSSEELSPSDRLGKTIKRAKSALTKVREGMADVDPDQEWVKSYIKELTDLLKDIRKPKGTADETAGDDGTPEPTTQQINDWAKSQGKTVTHGRPSKELRAEYDAAHKS